MNQETENTSVPSWVVDKTSRLLWEAYLRLVRGRPKVVSEKTPISKSAVAEEAGYQRSTLSKRRFPDLAELIDGAKQVSAPAKSMHAMYKEKCEVNRRLREQLAGAGLRREVLLNRLAELADRQLSMESELRLFRGDPESKVVPLLRK